MSVFHYLQLQTVDPQDDGTVSDLDMFEQDDVIDLTQEADGEELGRIWDDINKDIHKKK